MAEVIGNKVLVKRLIALGGKVARKVVRRNVRASAKPLRAGLRAAAPTAEGDLRKSIKTKSAPRSRNKIGVHVGSDDPGLNTEWDDMWMRNEAAQQRSSVINQLRTGIARDIEAEASKA